MKARSTLVGEMGNVTLLISSREDIFLLKSVTERTRDLDDMMSLFRAGLDKKVLLQECEVQTELAGFRDSQVWEAFLLVKIEEMEKRYGFQVPWKRALRSRAEVKLCARQLLDHIDKGVLSVKRLSDVKGEKSAFIEKCVRYLVKLGEVTLDARGRIRRRRMIKTDRDVVSRLRFDTLTWRVHMPQDANLLRAAPRLGDLCADLWKYS